MPKHKLRLSNCVKGGHHQIGIVKPFQYTEPNNKPFVVLSNNTNSSAPLNLACDAPSLECCSTEAVNPLPHHCEDASENFNEKEPKGKFFLFSFF